MVATIEPQRKDRLGPLHQQPGPASTGRDLVVADQGGLQGQKVRITSDTTKDRPTQVPLGPGESFGGVALCETLTTGPRWRFTRYGSAVTPATMTTVETALKAVRGIGEP